MSIASSTKITKETYLHEYFLGTPINEKTYELAKDKGFAFSCPHIVETTKYNNNSLPYTQYDKGASNFIPSQHILEKWLRRHHNLYVTVKPLKNKVDDTITYSYSVNDLSLSLSKKYSGKTRHKCYENALEQGLAKALSLIKF